MRLSTVYENQENNDDDDVDDGFTFYALSRFTVDWLGSASLLSNKYFYYVSVFVDVLKKESMTCGYFLLNRYQRYLSSLMHTLYVYTQYIHCFVSQAIRNMARRTVV